MKHNLRRIVAILLVAALICALFPLSVFAEDGQDVDPGAQDETVTATDPAPQDPEEDLVYDETPETEPPAEDETETEPAQKPDEDQPQEEEPATEEKPAPEEESAPAEEDEIVEEVDEEEPEAPATPAAEEPAPAEEEKSETEEDFPPVLDTPEDLPDEEAERNIGGEEKQDDNSETVTLGKRDAIPTNTGNTISPSWRSREIHLHYIKETGEAVYCIAPLKGSHDGVPYTEEDTEAAWESLSPDQQRAIQLAIGYGNKLYATGSPASIHDLYVQLAVQVLVWEFVNGERSQSVASGYVPVWGSDDDYTPMFKNTIGYGPVNWEGGDYARCRNAYDAILAAIRNHYTIPSFAVREFYPDESTPVYTLKYVAPGVYKAVLPEDENNILADYNWSAEGVTFTKNGNVLTVTTSDPAYITDEAVECGAHVLENYNPYVYRPDPSAPAEYTNDQPVILCKGRSDPIYAKFKLRVEAAPTMQTTATWQNGQKVVFSFDAKKVLESCNISEDVPSGKYKMRTVLWNLVDDNKVQEKISDEFEITNGEAYVFETDFDVTDVDPLPAAMVVLEYLYQADENGDYDMDNPYLIHDDKTDANQTVKIATVKIHTMAQTDLGDKFFTIGEDSEIVDKVYVEVEGNVAETEYTFTATLMEAIEQEDGSYKPSQVLINGNPVTVTKTAVIGPGETVVELVYKDLDWSQVVGKHLVVYESMDRTSDNVHITEHEDINDEDQSIHVPDAHTTATDVYTESHYTYAVPETTTVDEYHYSGLIKGKEYEVNGFMNKAKEDENGNLVDEGPVLLNGEPVVAYAKFTAEAESGVVLLYFTYPAVELIGYKTVVGETLYCNGEKIHYHYDVNDKEQTVTPIEPTLKTTATVDGEHVVYAGGIVQMLDVAEGGNYLPGNYKSVGQIMVKVEKDGETVAEPLLVNGEPVIATVYFTVEGEDGEPQDVRVEIDFDKFDSDIVRGLDTVVFEDVYWLRENENGEIEEIHVVEHHDVNDEHQTVSFRDFKFHTTATAGGEHSVLANGKVTVKDEIAFENAIVGTKLWTHAQLLERIKDEKTGKYVLIPFMKDGKQVEAFAEFTVDKENGTVEVTFPEFDASDLADRTFVVVETMFEVKPDGTKIQIGDEYDAYNKDQTISFYDDVKTGDSHNISKWYALLFGSMLGLTVLVAALVVRRKRARSHK